MLASRVALPLHFLMLSWSGAVFHVQNSEVTIKNCFFIANEAFGEGRGSAIFSLNSNITIYGSVFLNHNSKGNGGVIHAAKKSNVAIRRSFFESNMRNAVLSLIGTIS